MDVAKSLVFKGGTSLSKGWKLIQRFSEDIDLAIDRSYFGFDGDISGKAIGRLRKASNDYLSTQFFDALKLQFLNYGFDDTIVEIADIKRNEEDPIVFFVTYPALATPKDYMSQKVQIEIGCRSLREPFTMCRFGSLVDEHYSNNEFTDNLVDIPTVNPERTFLEKLFLLHEEFHKPKEKIRVDRLSRHLYDVYQLSKTVFAQKAVENKELYETIVAHRQKFSKIGGVNYDLHYPRTLDFIPVSEVIEDWKNDYQNMARVMIYEENPPTFEKIIKELKILRGKINGIY